MPQSRSARPVTTPAGNLGEARLHFVLGYQVAQSAIATVAVFDQLVGRSLELRPVEYTILMLITENPGVGPAKLAQALAVTAPNITTWIDRLAKRALVTREKNEADKRGQHLRATLKGKQLAAEATGRLLAGERAAFEGLTQGEWGILIELLQKVASFRPKKTTAARR